jgi:biotin carboxyl carrier protein
MIGFLLYTMNNRKIEAPVSSKHDVWSSIGFWRNMMKIDVAFGEEEIPVYINKANNNNYEFEIGEETFEAQLLAIDTGEIDFKIDDDSYLAEVNKGEDNFTKVKVNNEQFQFLRKDLLDTEVASHDDDNTGDDSNRIIAPIPGRVFKIEVKEGSQVKKGDLIMIIEAMKMENNITASKDCKISKLLVTLNEMVEAGHQLAEIE